jgi:hypothetical protein
MDKVTAHAIVSHRRAMMRLQKACDAKALPYPPELIEYLQYVRRFAGG